MKYKVSKEELDALFREVYSTAYEEEKNYTTSPLKEKEEYKFFAYRYLHPLRSFLISSIPVKLKLTSFKALEGKEPPEENMYISGYDVEKKFRIYITASDRFGEAVIDSSFDYSVLDGQFNPQNFLNSFAENIVQEIRRDFPYTYRKLSAGTLQFYDDVFIRFSYSFDINGESVNFSIWLDRAFVESEVLPPVIFSPPTTAGRKKLKKLKEMIKVNYILESEPVNINISDLKAGKELTLKLKFKEKVV
ncbi:hypothetical protein [Persephonella sp.]